MKTNSIRTLLFVALICLLWGCQEDKKKREIKPIGVKVLEIGSDHSNRQKNQMRYSGRIQADKTVNLSFQVSGTIEEIPVNLGDFVEKGTLIAAVDPTTYKKQYQAKQAEAKLARENYQRINAVFQKGSVAEIKMLKARSKYDQAESAAAAAYQNVKHTKLYAPVSGYVGNKMMEAGDLANPEMPVVQLLDLHSLKAVIAVPDEEINTHQIGNRAIVTISALKHEKMEGNVSEISINSSKKNPMYRVKININNPPKQVKPGMACQVHLKDDLLTTSVAPPEFVVPVKSVSVTEEGRNFVYIVNTEDEAEKRFVNTGRLYDEGIAITSGLQAGEKLVISGYHKLTDHTPVKIVQ